MNYKYTQTFKDIDSTSLGIAGGKGANLGEMTKAGFPVPPGFIINTVAYTDFINSYSEMDLIYNKLKKLNSDDLDEVRKTGKLIRETIEKIDVPEKLSKEVSERLKEFGEDNFFAVRSSATAEDLPGASFAGQQDTFLNIKGLENILINIRKCWVSLFTDRAILYRMEKGFSHREVKLSAVIQKMARPDVSGILFTVDPVSGNRNSMTIDAGFGLGEALVSGLINPDNYILDKKSFAILSANIQEKKIAIYPNGKGGIVTKKLEREQSMLRTLNDSQIKELCKIALKIENHYGTPQDIEWALEDGIFYLLQTRPVTTLFPLPESPRGREDHRIYVSLGHIQVMTAPVSPMGRSVLSLFLPFGRPKKPGVYNPYIAEAGERIYIEVTPFMTRKFIREKYSTGLQGVDYLMGKGVQESLSYSGVIKGIKEFEKKIQISSVFYYARKVIPFLLKSNLAKNPVKNRKAAAARLEKNFSILKNNYEEIVKTSDRLIYLRTQLEGFIDFVAFLLGTMAPALISWKKIGTNVRSWVEDDTLEEELSAIERGLIGNITTEMDLETGDLADLLKHSTKLVSLLKISSLNNSTLDKGRSLESTEEFFAAWDKFIARFGIRGLSEIDIKNARWKENPESLLKMMISQSENEKSGSHRKHFNNLTVQAEAAVEKLVNQVRSSAPGFIGYFRARKINKLLSLYRGYMPLREHGKYYLMRLMSLIRHEIKNSTILLADKSVLLNKDLIWFLEINELIELVGKVEKEENLSSGEIELLQKKIEERKERFERFKNIEPPRVILGNGTIPRPSYSTDGMPDGALPGMAVSSGIVEGFAKVITDPGKESIKSGEILVAPFTDPAWTPLFINASAVVIEVGGPMTHGSVIAREYGIPAVVSIENATKLITTGQKIRVNGDLGYVEIL